MNRYRRWVLWGVVAAGVGQWPAAAALAAEEQNACAMLQKDDVEAAFAPRKFGPGKPGVTVKATASRAAVSSCTYTSRGAMGRDRLSVTLGVRRAPSDAKGTTSEAARAGARQLKATPVNVAGLGDGAYWVALGGSIQLNVFRGRREWLTFGSRAAALNDDVVLARITRIARATMAR